MGLDDHPQLVEAKKSLAQLEELHLGRRALEGALEVGRGDVLVEKWIVADIMCNRLITLMRKLLISLMPYYH